MDRRRLCRSQDNCHLGKGGREGVCVQAVTTVTNSCSANCVGYGRSGGETFFSLSPAVCLGWRGDWKTALTVRLRAPYLNTAYTFISPSVFLSTPTASTAGCSIQYILSPTSPPPHPPLSTYLDKYWHIQGDRNGRCTTLSVNIT